MGQLSRLLFALGLFSISMFAAGGVTNASMPEPVLAELECTADFYVQQLGRTEVDGKALVLVRVII